MNSEVQKFLTEYQKAKCAIYKRDIIIYHEQVGVYSGNTRLVQHSQN